MFIPNCAGSILFPFGSEKYMEETIFSCRIISWYSPAFQNSCPIRRLHAAEEFSPNAKIHLANGAPGFPKCITHRPSPLSITCLNDSRFDSFKNRFQCCRIVHGCSSFYFAAHSRSLLSRLPTNERLTAEHVFPSLQAWVWWLAHPARVKIRPLIAQKGRQEPFVRRARAPDPPSPSDT